MKDSMIIRNIVRWALKLAKWTTSLASLTNPRQRSPRFLSAHGPLPITRTRKVRTPFSRIESHCSIKRVFCVLDHYSIVVWSHGTAFSSISFTFVFALSRRSCCVFTSTRIKVKYWANKYVSLFGLKAHANWISLRAAFEKERRETHGWPASLERNPFNPFLSQHLRLQQKRFFSRLT